MKIVFNCILSQDPDIRKGTSGYIADILVNEDMVTASRVEDHLKNFGLTVKQQERKRSLLVVQQTGEPLPVVRLAKSCNSF